MVKNKSLMRKIFRLREKAKAFINIDTPYIGNKTFNDNLNKALEDQINKDTVLI